jgi:hypothetical protein
MFLSCFENLHTRPFRFKQIQRNEEKFSDTLLGADPRWSCGMATRGVMFRVFPSPRLAENFPDVAWRAIVDIGQGFYGNNCGNGFTIRAQQAPFIQGPERFFC